MKYISYNNGYQKIDQGSANIDLGQRCQNH